MKTKKLGTLYFDGKPQEIGGSYNGEKISFGPTVPGKEIKWLKVRGLLVADRCLCNNISWDDLNDQGFAFGTIISINNQMYLCRCIKVGARDDASNEWDKIVDFVGEKNEYLHFVGMDFWGQEESIFHTNGRACRGITARGWCVNMSDSRRLDLGWRPILEPLGPTPRTPEELVGKEIKICGPEGLSLTGKLVSADEYDLVLNMVTPLFWSLDEVLEEDCPWLRESDDQAIIDRASVSWVREV